jgi:predicted nucleotidyltransferase
MRGKHVYFKAAADSPRFSPTFKGLLKTVGLADVLREVLRPLADRIHWAFIYGSVARSEEHSGRDVDLMIIGQVGLAHVESASQGRTTAQPGCESSHVR